MQRKRPQRKGEEPKAPRNYVGKVILIGSPAAGKTSLLNRIQNDEYDSNLAATWGMAQAGTHYKEDDHGNTYDVAWWDVGGQPKNEERSFQTAFKKANAILLCVRSQDIDSTKVMELNVKRLEEARKKAPNVPVFLVVTQTDMVKEESEITAKQKQFLEFASSQDIKPMHVLYTSSAANLGITEMVERVSETVLGPMMDAERKKAEQSAEEERLAQLVKQKQSTALEQIYTILQSKAYWKDKTHSLVSDFPDTVKKLTQVMHGYKDNTLILRDKNNKPITEKEAQGKAVIDALAMHAKNSKESKEKHPILYAIFHGKREDETGNFYNLLIELSTNPTEESYRKLEELFNRVTDLNQQKAQSHPSVD